MNPVTASRFVTKGGVGYGVDETQKDRATADWEIPNVSLENGWSKNWIFKKKSIWNGIKWIKQWIFMDIPKQPTALVAFHCIFGYIVTTNQALLTQSPQCVVARSHHLCLTKNVSLFIHSWVGKKLKNHPVFLSRFPPKRCFSKVIKRFLKFPTISSTKCPADFNLSTRWRMMARAGCGWLPRWAPEAKSGELGWIKRYVRNAYIDNLSYIYIYNYVYIYI